MNDFFIQIVGMWQQLNWLLVMAIFIAYAVVDSLYAYYTIQVVKLNPWKAATSGFIIHFILAFGIINYVNNVLYIIPIALGSWVGTFLMVRRERGNPVLIKKEI